MSKTKDSGANSQGQTPKKTSPEKQVIAIRFPILGRFNKMSALKEGGKCSAMIDDLERMFNEYEDCFKQPKEKMFAILEEWRKQLSEKYEYKLECKIQQNHLAVQKMTGEDDLLTEDRRALGRWKDEIEKKPTNKIGGYLK